MVFMFNAFATQEINPSHLLLAGSTTVTMLMAADPTSVEHRVVAKIRRRLLNKRLFAL
jgi:hypothetical protein